MRAVNLLPRDEQRARIEGARTPFLIAAGGIVFVTIVAALLSFSAAGSADDQKAQLADVESAIANLPKAPQSEVSQGTLIRERADRTNALAAALTTRVAFDRVLREISYVFPKGAWLTQFEASAPEVQTARQAAAPRRRRLPARRQRPPASRSRAQRSSIETVASVLARLALVPSLQNVQLTASTLVEPQAEKPPAGQAQPAKESRKAAKPKPKPKSFVTFVVTAIAADRSRRMRSRIASMSPRTLQIAAGVAVLVFAVALWFLLVAPKRSAAADAEAKLADAQLRLAEAQAAANKSAGLRCARLRRLPAREGDAGEHRPARSRARDRPPCRPDRRDASRRSRPRPRPRRWAGRRSSPSP